MNTYQCYKCGKEYSAIQDVYLCEKCSEEMRHIRCSGVPYNKGRNIRKGMSQWGDGEWHGSWDNAVSVIENK